jgi:hypothetical protein
MRSHQRIATETQPLSTASSKTASNLEFKSCHPDHFSEWRAQARPFVGFLYDGSPTISGAFSPPVQVNPQIFANEKIPMIFSFE